ncbi:hypothetical protein jhhlp_007315, partial [Lomentospora prolificans]
VKTGYADNRRGVEHRLDDAGANSKSDSAQEAFLSRQLVVKDHYPSHSSHPHLDPFLAVQLLALLNPTLAKDIGLRRQLSQLDAWAHVLRPVELPRPHYSPRRIAPTNSPRRKATKPAPALLQLQDHPHLRHLLPTRFRPIAVLAPTQPPSTPIALPTNPLIRSGMGAFSRSSPEDSSSSSSRSLFNRLIPLRSVKRNSEDFHIRPDEPHRTYSAGDHVHGAVILVVTKPFRITHLVVALHGFVRVWKGPSAVDDRPVPSGTSREQLPPKGYASLFQDEQVLSGDGKLDVGRYEFKFDLVFPTKVDLPSSIDFERGTISYNIMATLTRPTTISPTLHCDRKVALVEKVDVGLLPPPRPRIIFLEPISKRTRRKKTSRSGRSVPPREQTLDPSSDADSVGPSIRSEDPVQEPHPINPQSSTELADTRSVVSGESNFTGSTGLSLPAAEVLSQTSNPAIARSTSLAKLQAVDAKTITTTIELLKAGCIPGDTIPVRITVQHIKHVRSMHGVIVTLYRQGRIDPTVPSTTLGHSSGARGAFSLGGDRSTKSRSSLSFSLSNKSSPSIYRKDLCQTVVPLIIDPHSLSTSVNVSVKVPDGSFPTIKNVPSDMISFKYHLEVVVDLGGRLDGQFQSSETPARFGVLGAGASPVNGASSTYTSWSTNIINTEHLRREKGVVFDGLEIIVGTLDSSRLRGKTNSRRTFQHPNTSSTSQDDSSLSWRNDRQGPLHVNGGDYPSPRLPTNENSNSYMGAPSSSPPDAHYAQYPDHPPPPSPLPPPHSPREASEPEAPAPLYIPPPVIPDVNNLTEKERVRLQEQRLLPSAPPGGSSASGPSASAPLEDNIYDADDTAGPSAPPLDALHATAPSALALDDFGSVVAGPSQPQMTPQPSQPEGAGDKQELERQRLLGEASAPPEFPDDCEPSGSGSTSVPGASIDEPTAPVLSEEEDDYGAHYSYSNAAAPSMQRQGHSEPLPRYEQ